MRVFFVILFSAFLFQPAFSQELEQKPVTDSLVNEEIIYEVDTVYLQPDTVNLFDTIVHYVTKPVRKFPLFVEISGSSFVSGLFDFAATDTLTINKTLNFSGSLTFAYIHKSIFWGINIGFSQLEDNITYRKYPYSAVKEYASYYDSLVYTGNCNIRNYYNYLNAALVFGKKWTGKGKFSYRAILHAGGDILLKHYSYSLLSDAENKLPIPASDLRKITVYFDLSTSIGYSVGKKTDIFIAPYCKFSLRSGKDYPLSNKAVVGLRFGFIKYF